MYQKCIDTITGQQAQCIKRLADDAFIPFDQDNFDYRVFLAWLADGGVLVEAEVPDAD